MARSRRPPPRPRKHRHGDKGRARIGLAVIFCLLLVVEGFFYLALPVDKPGLSIPLLLGGALWTTALLIALWRRQQWARILLIGLFGLFALFATIMVPNTLGPKDRDLLMAYFVGGLMAIGSGAYLVYSRDMHRLTSRDRD